MKAWKIGEFSIRDTEAVAYYIFGVTYSTALYRAKNNKNVSSNEIYDKINTEIISGFIK